MIPLDVAESSWGAYRLAPIASAQLLEHPDGSLEISAEGRYLLEYSPSTSVPKWQGLRRLRDGLAEIQLMNYVGDAELGGRRIHVWSRRLDAAQVSEMLDEVVAALQSLPFTYGTPTAFAYERDATVSEDVLYQAYAFVRHALNGIGPHDLPTAINRILVRPHRRLVASSGVVPIGRAHRIDHSTIIDLATRARPMFDVRGRGALASAPLVKALGGRAPARVQSTHVVDTTETPENAFVARLLESSSGVVAAFAEAVRERDDVGAASQLEEARELATTLHRWQRHPVLAALVRKRPASLESSVLRGRPGYREATRFFVDLQARTRLLPRQDAERLLEVRDAALIYEYWCYFRVVSAVGAVLGQSPAPLRFTFGAFGASLPRATAVRIGEVVVWFNREFRKESYSVPLRPDITLELPGSHLHLFDAKLKHDPGSWTTGADSDEDDSDTEVLTYRRGDLYKMHTYRDALSAKSVWILYPGKNMPIKRYSPTPPSQLSAGVLGVGAVPLMPGSTDHQAGLTHLIAEILKESAASAL